ncbi:serine/threonine protein kinase, partial [Myxococcota bacterium]|nr:serine/threonine protein kinase [Myxococcota bacterium]
MLACPKCGSVYTRELDRCGLDGERLVETSADPLIGRTVDRYRIDAAIGDGGMARVYRAHHVYLAQDFAIKVLFGEVASDRALARRFQREAQASSRIRHANVVQISDFGETPEGLIFMAMELLRGRTLSDVIREEGALPPARAAYFLRQIASGLAAAHALGFVHRDLKPKNVMLIGEPGHELAKILDFGLVLFTERSGIETSSLTQQGQVFGTPAYMAPEQVSGTDVGPAADLYALGVILHQMLRGVVPFNGTPAQVAVQHVSAPPPLIDDFSGLGPLAARCLQKKPDDRPASATAIVELIDALALVTLRPPDVHSHTPTLARPSAEVGGVRVSSPSSDLPRATPSMLSRAPGSERPRTVTQPIDGAPPAPVDRALADARAEPEVALGVAIDDAHTPGDLGAKLAIESSHGSLPPLAQPITSGGRPEATPRDDVANFDEA